MMSTQHEYHIESLGNLKYPRTKCMSIIKTNFGFSNEDSKNFLDSVINGTLKQPFGLSEKWTIEELFDGVTFTGGWRGPDGLLYGEGEFYPEGSLNPNFMPSA